MKNVCNVNAGSRRESLGSRWFSRPSDRDILSRTRKPPSAHGAGLRKMPLKESQGSWFLFTCPIRMHDLISSLANSLSPSC
jgi:hypothetical protein